MKKEAQQELYNIDRNIGTEVSIPRCKKRYSIKYLTPDTTGRLSALMLKNEAPDGLFSTDDSVKPDPALVASFISKKITIAAKMASLVILNNFWKNSFFHWIYWRWLHYVKQYDFEQLSAIIIEGKKKMVADGFYLSMVLGASMMDTMRTMTKTEAEEYLRELSLATGQHSEKSSHML